MSLLKQLLLSVTLAILVILVGTLALSIGSARQYLDGQLQSESENAASSLALSLSQSANQDPVIRELLMLALFDSGRFQSIEFTAPDGTSLFSRRQAEGKAQPGLAPAWFTRWLPLAPAQTVREVSDGWRQVGRLSLQVDSSYANDALWRSSSRMALLVLTAGAVWALFVVGLLNWFRRVLRDEISAQVRDIGSRESTEGLGPQPSKAPVDELAVVVRAIRDTRERVRATDKEQTARIESLELETNCDAVTGLPNRKYFVHELGRVLHGELGNAAAHGQVLLFRLHDLPGLNAGMTRTSVDQWLVLMGQRVQAVLVEQGQTKAQVARLNGSEFAVLLPGLLGPQAMQVVQQLRHALQALRIPLADGRCSRWNYALTDYSPSCRVSEVLTRLDQALMGGTGHDEVEFLANEGHKTLRSAVSQSQWQQLLSTALAAPDSLSLAVYRHVYAGAKGEQVLNEALLVLHAAEESVLAGSLFMPVAVRLGLSAAFDLRAVTLGLQWLRQHPDERLVLRVSLPSLAHADFLGQLQEVMHGDASDLVLPRLSLELDAHGLVAYPLEMRACCAAVVQAGASTGLRRLDQEPKALALLHTLALAYVKWGTHSPEEGLESPGGRYLLEAVVHTTQALGLRLYVTDDADGQAVALLRGQGAYVLVAQPSSAA